MLLKTRKKRILTVALSLALAAGSVGCHTPSEAAAIKPVLSTSKITLNVGKTKKVTVNPGSFTLLTYPETTKRSQLRVRLRVPRLLQSRSRC